MIAPMLKAGPEAYRRTATVLSHDSLVALPTETVYGLAGDARSDAAIAAIYAAKGRPSHNPLITHLLRPDIATHYADIPALAMELIVRFWPGPLTLVLPRRTSNLAARASAGLDTLALRCPDAPWRQGLIDAGWTAPLVMPSANLSGHVSPTEAAHVAADLGERIDLIIDGGRCKAGLESTVVRIDGDKAHFLRSGIIPAADIEATTGPLTHPDPDSVLASPGMLTRHYAPEATLRLNATNAHPGETLIGFGPNYDAPNLSAMGDLSEAAHNLYRMLRDWDGPECKIAIAPIAEDGMGAAINDRLRRATLGR